MAVNQDTTYRHCTRCSQTKPRTEFPSNKKSGFFCLACHRKYNKAWYQEHLKERREQIKLYGRTHPHIFRKSAERYRKNDPELYRQRAHDWYQRNKERLKALREKRHKAAPHVRKQSAHRWKLNNKGKLVEYKRNRLARQRGASGRHSQKDVQLLFMKQGGKCESCRITIKDGFHVDHIMPIILGGSNGPENIQLLCPSCNRRKSKRSPQEWALMNGRLF